VVAAVLDAPTDVADSVDSPSQDTSPGPDKRGKRRWLKFLLPAAVGVMTLPLIAGLVVLGLVALLLASDESEDGNGSGSFPAATGNYIWPVSGTITSLYGPRVSPGPGASSFHEGVDVGAPEWTEIVAAADGQVTQVHSPHATCGNMVVITHSDKERTWYCHQVNGGIKVAVGDYVSQGQPIGAVGNTGVSYGAGGGYHLHFGVQQLDDEGHWEFVNPAPDVATGQTVEAGTAITGISLLTPVPQPGEPNDVAANKAFAQQLMRQEPWGWTDPAEWQCLDELWDHESGWNYLSANSESSARGIPQAMMSLHFGTNWETNPDAIEFLNSPQIQIRWGLDYIKSGNSGNALWATYTPCGAWNYWRANGGWY